MAAPVKLKFLNSNVMYIVASYLIEQISGLGFAEYLKEYFFRPLHMNSTYLQPQSAIDAGLRDRIATPYNWNETSQNYTTVKLIAIMNQEPPISTPIYHDLTRPRIISEDTATDVPEWGEHASPAFYAAGWEVIYYHGYKFVLHNGGVSGFGSFHFFLPELKFGGVVNGNSDWVGLVGTRLCAELISEALNVCPLDDFPEWSSVAKLLKDQEEKQAKELRQELCPDLDHPEPQRRPLSEYVGRYWNAGYRSMTADVQDDRLFINATDRTEAFTLIFEHLCKQTKYVAHLTDYYDSNQREIAAEFVIRRDKIVRMGLRLEDELDHPVWFDRQSELPWTDNDFAFWNPSPAQAVLK